MLKTVEEILSKIQLEIGPNMGLSVGWQRHAKKNAKSIDVKVGQPRLVCRASKFGIFCPSLKAELPARLAALEWRSRWARRGNCRSTVWLPYSSCLGFRALISRIHCSLQRK